jgi:phosphoribosylformimino-5-aminoimidazole carboxamide ribotide isomerase
MYKFRIIPVIDILNSRAVHAIKGERDKYKPLLSKILSTSNPLEIVKILNNQFHFKEVYIADLDAIIKNKPNFKLLTLLLDDPMLNILLDPGIKDEEDILNYLKFKLNKLILGLETINNLNVLKEAINIIGSDALCISIDMYKGKIITKLKEFKGQTPVKFIKILNNLNIKEIILLDLYRVGQKLGGIPPLYLKVRNKFQGEILVGGGVKDFNDIKLLYNHKFSGVLIGTALYDGSIKIENLNYLS